MNPILAWLLGEGIDVGAEKTGLKDRARGIMSDLADAIIPPAAASDASAIPQQNRDISVRQGFTPIINEVPADRVLTQEEEQLITPKVRLPDGRVQMPTITMQEPTSPAMVDVTDQKQVDDVQNFVRSIGGRTKALMEETPEGNPQEAAALATVEALASKGMEPEPMDLGAPVQFGPTDVALGQYPDGKPQPKEPDFFDKAGGFLTDLFGDEERMTRMALAFNSMRLQPDQGLATVLGKRLETLQANKRDNKTAVVVAKRLTEMGYPQYAKIVMERPDMAAEVLKQIMQKELKPESAIKTSAVLTDPTTGQQYVVKTDPNTGTVERMNIEGAVGLTPQAKADLEASTASTTLDLKTAQEYGQKVFDQAQSINGQIGRLEEVSRAIDAGAVTGPISQFLPTITKATASLEAAANSLGIDIINSATFGALSETELRLALSTGLPQGLPEAELQKWVKSKIAAQKKLRDELFRQAQTLLSGGVRYTEWASNFAKQALEKSAQEQAATPTAPTAPTAAPQSEEELFKTVEIQ